MASKPKGPQYRYSIIPARAITDPDITAQALRVLALLGRHTDENGWCRRSQVKMAEEMGCGRGTIQRGLEELVNAGYVEKREETRTGEFVDGRQPHCSHSYRVRLDLEDEEEVPARGHGKVPAGGQGVPSHGGQGVPTSRAPLTEPSPLNLPLDNPLAPADAGEGVAEFQIGKGYPERFEEFRDTWAKEMPGGFPAKDEAAARHAFQRVTRRLAPDALIACGRLHGQAETRRKNSRRGDADDFRTMLPSTWLNKGSWEGYAREAAAAGERAAAEADAVARVSAVFPAEAIQVLRARGASDATLATLDGVTFQVGPSPSFTCTNSLQRAVLDKHMYQLEGRLGEGLRIVLQPRGRAAG